MMTWFLPLLVSAQAAGNPFLNDLENFKDKSLSLKSSQQNRDASEDLLLSRKLFWTPKLSLSAAQSQSRVNETPSVKEEYLLADVKLNLFRGGGDWNSLQDAKAQVKAQELNVLNESLRTEIKASNLIFKSLYLTESQRIQEQILKLKEETLKIVSDRYRQGKLPLQEMTKSEVDLVQQRSRVRTARLDYIENKSQITSSFIVDLQTQAWPFSEKTNFQTTGSSRLPLVEEKFWLSQSREQIWKSSRSMIWPSLDLQLQYKEFPIRERSSHEWSGVVALTFPLWDRYETSARISSAYADYIGAQNDYKETEQSLKQKELFLKEKIEVARANLVDAKKNLEASRKLYQDILRSFRLGRISTNDLFIEQNRLFESETALAFSQLNFHQSLIETCALLGVNAAACLR